MGKRGRWRHVVCVAERSQAKLFSRQENRREDDGHVSVKGVGTNIKQTGIQDGEDKTRQWEQTRTTKKWNKHEQHAVQQVQGTRRWRWWRWSKDPRGVFKENVSWRLSREGRLGWKGRGEAGDDVRKTLYSVGCMPMTENVEPKTKQKRKREICISCNESKCESVFN